MAEILAQGTQLGAAARLLATYSYAPPRRSFKLRSQKTKNNICRTCWRNLKLQIYLILE